MFKVAITDMAAYNEGNLIYHWVELPIDEEDLREEIDSVLKEGFEFCQEEGNGCYQHEEWFVTDVEGPGMRQYYHQYMDVFKLNSLLEDMVYLAPNNEVLKTLTANLKYKDALNVLENEDYIIHYVDSEAELARQFVEETMSTRDDIPRWISNHIDYKAIYDRELRFDSDFVWDDGICIEILHG